MQQTPAQLVGFSSTVKAFYFNRGVWRFGTSIENALAEVENSRSSGKGKSKSAQWVTLNRQRVLDKYLGATEEQKAKRYKDPAIRLGKEATNASPKVKMQDERTEVELGADFIA